MVQNCRYRSEKQKVEKRQSFFEDNDEGGSGGVCLKVCTGDKLIGSIIWAGLQSGPKISKQTNLCA